MQDSSIGPLTVTPYPAAHTGETNPTSLRTAIAGKVVSYTGDSAWTKYMPAVARAADLFICECYFHGKPIRFHMNYPDIVAHQAELTPKRMILTHFSREMMLHKDEVPEETAYDGLVVAL
jgi:ribonuclease BN (tRNA processing enzyme)